MTLSPLASIARSGKSGMRMTIRSNMPGPVSLTQCCHCGYKGHGLLIFCWSLRCNCLPTQDMTTTNRLKYQTTLIKGLHDEKKSIVLFVVRALTEALQDRKSTRLNSSH